MFLKRSRALIAALESRIALRNREVVELERRLDSLGANAAASAARAERLEAELARERELHDAAREELREERARRRAESEDHSARNMALLKARLQIKDGDDSPKTHEDLVKGVRRAIDEVWGRGLTQEEAEKRAGYVELLGPRPTPETTEDAPE